MLQQVAVLPHGIAFAMHAHSGQRYVPAKVKPKTFAGLRWIYMTVHDGGSSARETEDELLQQCATFSPGDNAVAREAGGRGPDLSELLSKIVSSVKRRRQNQDEAPKKKSLMDPKRTSPIFPSQAWRLDSISHDAVDMAWCG